MDKCERDRRASSSEEEEKEARGMGTIFGVTGAVLVVVLAIMMANTSDARDYRREVKRLDALVQQRNLELIRAKDAHEEEASRLKAKWKEEEKNARFWKTEWVRLAGHKVPEMRKP